jgi:nicotinamide riboside kinase
METIKKFVIIGPESTGKSTLCGQLADHFDTLWVPEYAREYLEKNGTDYNYGDLLTIAKGQIKLEEEGIRHYTSGIRHPRLSNTQQKKDTATSYPSSVPPSEDRGLLFIDTDMYVMKVWCEFVFNKCHSWILNRIAERSYEGYLLCNADLQWVKDDLREYPDEKVRNKLFHFYKDLLVNQQVPWTEISGNYEERFDKAVSFVNQTV